MNMNILNYFFLFLMFFFNSCYEKKTSVADNSSVATSESSSKDSLKLIADLSNKINETSGLIFYKSKLFTHNDKGNPNQLFVIDTLKGLIQNIIVLANAQSIDYEDIAQSDKYIFVGDFGNNHGHRRDLCIYRFKKTDINFNKDTINVSTNRIGFRYPEQESFKKTKDHNFDCEAMIYYKDSLYLFTKNRLDSRCNLYIVPNEPGEHNARLIANFDSKGLITGADINADGSKVVLTGYNKKGNSFLWVLSDYKPNDFFSGKARQIILGPFDIIGQIEGICFSNKHKLFISAEKTADNPPKLYSFSL